jgi:molybdenum cofactor cytidylyltransferase
VKIAGLVLAAGASSRFGGQKILARLDGRPLLEHVLETSRVAGLSPIVVVVGDAEDAIRAGIRWEGERLVRNPAPDRGLSSSLAVGLAEIARIDPAIEGAVVLLGDQPLTRPDVVAALLAAADDGRPVVAPQYAGGGGANPVLLRQPAFSLVAAATGDRGLGPLLASRPDLVHPVPVPGTNPDVDTAADLASIAAAAWDDQVAANREQVSRVREAAERGDFFASVSSLFRADPDRTDDPVLGALLEEVRSEDVVLDIGCGAGRYALPLARRVREVIGVDPSAAMLSALEEGMEAHQVSNIRVSRGRWPASAADLARVGETIADVSLIAHLGYAVSPIEPFLVAMEDATRRRCVAILMDRAPASVVDPFWPVVHGEALMPLPAAGSLIDLLAARGREVATRWLDRPPRAHASRDEMVRFLRRHLWITAGGEKDARLAAMIPRLTEERGGRWYLRGDGEARIAVTSWAPR